MFSLEPYFSTLFEPVTQANRTDLMALSLADFIQAQGAESLCQTAARKLDKDKAVITISEEVFLVQLTQVQQVLQRLLLQSKQYQILSSFYYLPLSDYSGQRVMCDKMRRNCF